MPIEPSLTRKSTCEPKPLDQLRDWLRVKHYSIRTGQGHVDWVRRITLFHDFERHEILVRDGRGHRL